MELHFMGLDMAYMCILLDVGVRVAPMLRPVTRAVTQARLAYGIFTTER